MRDEVSTDVSRPAGAPIWLLALITLSGTLGMHVFVPALPAAAASLGATPPALQFTISGYILGLAVGQLAYGPLADRYGRRPVLVGGLALYSAAGVACALSGSVSVLIAARVLQALGGCTGLVIGRAMVRDTAAGGDATRRMALVNLVVTAGPGIAPLVGGMLAATLGWRSIFVATCALGIVNLVLTLSRVRETAKLGAATDARFVLVNYGKLIRSPAFLCYAVGGACATTSWYAFVSAAPFIFVNQLHRPTAEVGVWLATIVVFLWLGSVAASRLALSITGHRMLTLANGISLTGAVVLVGTVASGYWGLGSIVAAMCLFALGVGMSAAPALVEAVSVNTNVIGSASGLYGFVQMLMGAFCVMLAGIGSDPALSAALILLGASLLALVLLRAPAYFARP